MKILCISDQIDSLIYSPAIKERFSDIDLVVSAGDLPMEYLGYIVTCLNKPLLYVFGNHNLSEYTYITEPSLSRSSISDEVDGVDHSFGSTHIGFKIRRIKGLIFMGLGGSIMYNNGLNQYTNFQMLRKILKMVPHLLVNRIFYGRYLDILVTHAPPLGIHDKNDPCHVGFKPFLWFMRTFKPKYLIHGHIHLYDLNDVRSSVYHETVVLNAYSHHILDLGEAP
jgi:uncharacterized protein